MAGGKMTEHSWDTWMGFRGTRAAFQYYPVESWKNDKKISFETNKPDDVRRPGIVGGKGAYSEDLFMEEISTFIRENQEDPFFLYFPSQVPHGRSPWSPRCWPGRTTSPPEYLDTTRSFQC